MPAVDQLKRTLRAVDERIDPHVGPLIAALEAIGRARDEDLASRVQGSAGPAVTAALPKLLSILRTQGGGTGPRNWPGRLPMSAGSTGPRSCDSRHAVERRRKDADFDDGGARRPRSPFPPGGRPIARLREWERVERCLAIRASASRGRRRPNSSTFWRGRCTMPMATSPGPPPTSWVS